MQRFIIGGVPRSGKSTISKHLSAKLKLSHFPVDSLVSTFGKIYPQLGISHYGESFTEICEQLWPFLKEYLQQLEYEDIGYVFDVYHIRPSNVVEIINGKDDQVLFIGYPKISTEEKVSDIRKYARKQDWTKELTDEELSLIVKRLIEESQVLQEECQKYGLKFIDTSENYSAVIESAYQELSRMSKKK